MRPLPRLHAITDDARLAHARFVDDAAAVLEAGGADVALHLRGREITAARLFELTLALLPIARAHGASLLVNDRVDVALAAHADGAQLREDSIDAAAARTLLGRDALIGVSRHAGSGAAIDGADFVVFGSVFETASHPGRPPVGVEGLRDAVSGVRDPASGAAAAGGKPLVAIGGITPERVAEVMRAGAYGVAAISGIWERGPDAIDQYRSAIGVRTTEYGLRS